MWAKMVVKTFVFGYNHYLPSCPISKDICPELSGIYVIKTGKQPLGEGFLLVIKVSGHVRRTYKTRRFDHMEWRVETFTESEARELGYLKGDISKYRAPKRIIPKHFDAKSWEEVLLSTIIESEEIDYDYKYS